MAKIPSGIKKMKLVAIKKECYAISGVDSTRELKQKYVTLCKGRDFRRRKTWEYVLKTLQTDGDWIGIKISDIEKLAEKERKMSKTNSPEHLTFHPRRVEMDEAANNDD